MNGTWRVVAGGFVLIALAGLLSSCQGTTGPVGPAGAPGSSSGTLSGSVSNGATKAPLAGLSLAIDPAVDGIAITSGADGTYSAQLPVGTYKLTYKKDDFTAASETVTIVAGQKASKDVALKPVVTVKVNAGADQPVEPGATVTLKANTTAFDTSTVNGYSWVQVSGVPAVISGADSDTLTVKLADARTYKDDLLKRLDQLERFKVQAINPFAIDEAEIAVFKVTADTSGGPYTDTVSVVAKLPYVVNGGLSNVPVGLPVLIHAKTQVVYKWALTVPEGSKAALDSVTDQNPSFTPDVAGKYTLLERATNTSIDVVAGTWAGAISGQDAKGRPVSAACTVCHNGKIAPDNFTAWKNSGHSEILTNNINDPAGHWSLSCAGCHSVGYNPGVTNNGFSDAIAAEGWKAPAHGDPANWTDMLANDPKSASLANIQCENCHGPNNSSLHANKQLDAARITLSAEACGACHGEPTRHGRFQQWQESGHGNAQLAIDESGSSSCIRCHTAQGFLTWLQQGDLTKSIQGANGNATAAEIVAMGLTKDTAEPITCAVCHDPHDVGTTTGDPTNAKVRIMGDTPMLPSGYQAKLVGKGAICITCHNTRNAAHNDSAPPTSYSAPHRAAQGDVLMGENAYFVGVPSRSPHADIKDACVTCHMEATPPPAEYSNAGSGTNHGFAASTEICATCHSSSLNAEALKIGTEDKIARLGTQMGAYLLNKMPAKVTVKDYAAHTYGGVSYDLASDLVQLSKDNIASLEPAEPHGQQGYLIKLKAPVAVTYKPAGETPHTMTLSAVTVQLGSITTDGTVPVVAAADNLVKVGWNYFLIEGDSSMGIHNPAFAADVLNASMAALK